MSGHHHQLQQQQHGLQPLSLSHSPPAARCCTDTSGTGSECGRLCCHVRCPPQLSQFHCASLQGGGGGGLFLRVTDTDLLAAAARTAAAAAAGGALMTSQLGGGCVATAPSSSQSHSMIAFVKSTSADSTWFEKVTEASLIVPVALAVGETVILQTLSLHRC